MVALPKLANCCACASLKTGTMVIALLIIIVIVIVIVIINIINNTINNIIAQIQRQVIGSLNLAASVIGIIASIGFMAGSTVRPSIAASS